MRSWVFLRGLMREARHWGDFPTQFKQVSGAERIITVDFPGNGSLSGQLSPISIAEMANHCRAYLNGLGIQPPYQVLALSLGAMVAVEWSAKHPEELERLVLINTSLAPLNPFYHRLRPENYLALFRHLICGSILERERIILSLTSALQRTPGEETFLLDQWQSFARECPVSRANILRQLLAAISFRACTTPSPVPLLLLAGELDRLVNVKCSIALANRWDCPVKLHPTAGHDLPLDDGQWVARQVKEWIDATKLAVPTLPLGSPS
jgi:pimeloyl-ACP methyl ester carboxylesterase